MALWTALLAMLIGWLASDQTLLAQEFNAIVKGKIVDSNKNPVTGANVLLVNRTDRAVGTRKTKSDSNGSYSLEYKSTGLLVLIVQKNGLAIASKNVQVFPNQTTNEVANDDGLIEKNVDFELQPGNSFEVEFVDQDDQPITLMSAGVNYCSSENDYISIFGDELEMKVDGNKVFVDSVPDNSYMSLKIKRMNDVHFDASFPHNFKIKRIKIETDSVIEGTAVDMQGNPLTNLELSLNNWHSIGDQEKPTFSLSTNHETKTDNDGKFKFVVPSGGSWIRSKSDKYYLAGESERYKSIANETTKVALKFKRTSEVHGSVVDESGNGVAGVKLNVSSANGFVTTDEEGNYSFRSTLNPAYISYSRLPDGFISSHVHNSVEIPDGKSRVQADEIVLESSAPVSGIVVDDENKPVANARIVANWQQRNGRFSTGASDFAVSDSAGKFILKNTSRKSKLGLIANAEGVATCSVKLLNIDDDRKNVKLVVESAGMIGIKGSVFDSNDNPISGASISLKKAFVMPEGHFYGETKIFPEVVCTTNSNGEFEFPNKLARTGKYSINVNANGFTSFESPMLTCESGKSFIELKKILVNRTISVSGKIVDEAGKPVANAEITGFKVRERGSSGKSEKMSLTNEGGEFELDNLHPNCRILFVNKKGFRYRGFAIDNLQDNVKFELESINSPSKQTPLGLFARDKKQRQLLLNQLAQDKFAQGKLSSYSTQTIFRMAGGANPEINKQVLDRLPDNYQKCGVLFALGEIDEATEIASSQNTPQLRTRAFRLGALEVKDVELKKELLREAGAHATSIQDAGARIEAYGGIIEELYDAGDLKSAKALSQIAIPIGLVHGYEGRGNFARGWLARATVEMFPEKSVALVENIQDQSSFDRHHGNLAHEMAAIDPVLAQQLVEKLKHPGSQVVKVVYRMGSADPERAIELVNNTKFRETRHHANALAVLAYALKDSSPEKARDLLGRAVAKMVNELDHRYTLGTAINILRFACEVDPTNANQYYWQLLKLFSDPNSDAWGANDAKSAAQLRVGRQALLLALFDKFPKVQRELMSSILEDFRDFSDKNDRWFNDMTDRGHLFVAMTIAMPKETINWCKWYYENISPDKARYLPQPWEVIGWTLSKSPTEVADYSARELLHVWVIDEEDF